MNPPLNPSGGQTTGFAGEVACCAKLTAARAAEIPNAIHFIVVCSPSSPDRPVTDIIESHWEFITSLCSFERNFGDSGMRRFFAAAFSILALAAQTPPARKQLLLIGDEKGYRHQAISHAMSTIERLGRESGLWDTHIRTDTEPLTKKKLEYNAKNLSDFDAVLFYTGGNLTMDEQQRADFLSFIRDDGKGFVGVHSASITWVQWPEFVDLLGGTYDEHPWNTFAAPILVEDPAFPGMNLWPRAFTLTDEIYQVKGFSRENTRVLLRLDASKLDLSGARVHRQDRDFAVAWAKMYGKGRVFYSTIGHVEENWDRPEVQQMYREAIRWALKLVDADITPRPLPSTGN